jgi:hypothetical protein
MKNVFYKIKGNNFVKREIGDDVFLVSICSNPNLKNSEIVSLNKTAVLIYDFIVSKDIVSLKTLFDYIRSTFNNANVKDIEKDLTLFCNKLIHIGIISKYEGEIND